MENGMKLIFQSSLQFSRYHTLFSFWVWLVFFILILIGSNDASTWSRINLVEDRMYWCYFFALNTLKGLPGRMCH